MGGTGILKFRRAHRQGCICMTTPDSWKRPERRVSPTRRAEWTDGNRVGTDGNPAVRGTRISERIPLAPTRITQPGITPTGVIPTGVTAVSKRAVSDRTIHNGPVLQRPVNKRPGINRLTIRLRVTVTSPAAVRAPSITCKTDGRLHVPPSAVTPPAVPIDELGLESVTTCRTQSTGCTLCVHIDETGGGAARRQ
jgi:hypothetical protein